MALELLRKAETLTEEGDKYRAVTYNNFACIFRRTKKLRSALSYLEKALEIEYNYLHFSDESVDDAPPAPMFAGIRLTPPFLCIDAGFNVTTSASVSELASDSGLEYMEPHRVG